MNNAYATKSKLKQFIKLHSKAQAVIVRKDNILVFSAFNGYYSLRKFRFSIEKKYQDAYFSHIEYMANAYGDSIAYANGVLKQLDEFLSFYSFKDELHYHKNLIVLDSDENILDYDQLPADVKTDISLFISVLKNSLTCFILKLNGQSDAHLFLIPSNGNLQKPILLN